MSDKKAAAKPEVKAEEDRNIWQDLLANSSSAGWNTAKTATSTLVFLGDRVNGKSSVLNKFRDRVTDVNNPAEYILDFSYINVKNRFNLDADETVSRMSVWQLDDQNHVGLLHKLIPAVDLDNTGIVITFDLSKPWDVLVSLNKWLEVAKSIAESLSSQLTPEQSAALKLKISKAVQQYVDPGTASTVALETKKEEPAAEAPKEEGEAPKEGEPATTEPASGPAELPVDPAIPAKNLGVPLIFVGTKADYFNRVLAKSGADEKFEFVASRIRKIALEWGATTVFTSAVGEGQNIELLQDYLNYRLLNLPNKNAAKVVCSAEDITLFAPAGFDSLELISSGASAKSPWGDATKMEEVFPNPEPKRKAEDEGELVVAMDNDTFFKALRAQLDKGVPFAAAPSASPDSKKGGGEQQKYVKSFFKSLLTTGPKDKK